MCICVPTYLFEHYKEGCSFCGVRTRLLIPESRIKGSGEPDHVGVGNRPVQKHVLLTYFQSLNTVPLVISFLLQYYNNNN